jgi:ComF family protein
MSRFKRLIRVADDFLSLIFPRICQSCGEHLVRNELLICIACLADMPTTDYHIMRDNNLEKELWGRCYVERAAAMCYYRRESRMQNLIHRLKYHGVTDIGVYLGEYYGRLLKNSGFTDDIDSLIPVPLHPSKRLSRGFNQSSLICEGISQSTGLELIEGVLIRSSRSSTQTRRSRSERWENVEGIFEVSNSERIENKHILLVDDVVTTGSTVEACVNKLKEYKGVRVSVAALATAVQ